MTVGNPTVCVVKFAFPMLIGLVFQQLYNMTDSTLVGYYVGTNSIAVVGVTSGINVLFFGFIMALNQGYSIVISRLFGENKKDDIKKSVAILLLFNSVSTLLFTAISLVGVKPLLILLKTPQELIDPASQYISIVLLGLGFSAFYNMFACILTALGNSKIPFILLSLGFILNIFVSLLFIKIFNLGVLGAAVGTVTAQGVCTLLCILYCRRYYKEYLGLFLGFELYFSPLSFKLLKSGLSMALSNSTIALGAITVQLAINGFGPTAIAAYAVARRIFVLFTQPYIAFSAGMSTFVGQNCGAGHIGRVRQATKKAIGICFALGAVGMIFLWFFSESITSLLAGNKTPDLLYFSITTLHLTAPFLAFFGISSVLKTVLQAMQCRGFVVCVSFLELAARIVFITLFSDNLSYTGISLIEPVLWVLTAIPLSIVTSIKLRRID